MSYKVIARKYRPQTFADLVGQQHVTKTLANAINSNRVAHAYIFSGVRGVGKTTTARILAKALNCMKGPTAEPDNTCDACREIAAGTSLDVLEIDAASNRGIDQIRELREMVRYAPASSRYKVVILDEAHQLTDEASNALLKTLEEPPERVVFILATTRSEDLVETIKSRAQLFQFRALTFQEIAGEIERVSKAENLPIDSGAVAVLARAAEGSLRDGLSLLEQAIAYSGDAITDTQVRELLGVVAESVLDELVDAIAAQSAERALGLVHRLIADGQNLQRAIRRGRPDTVLQYSDGDRRRTSPQARSAAAPGTWPAEAHQCAEACAARGNRRGDARRRERSNASREASRATGARDSCDTTCDIHHRAFRIAIWRPALDLRFVRRGDVRQRRGCTHGAGAKCICCSGNHSTAGRRSPCCTKAIAQQFGK
ncbi:MAG: DNA polymerase III subunit gamma/tau [Candidatus Acidiferrales bacterium]